MTAAEVGACAEPAELISVVVCTAGRRPSIWRLLQSAVALADPAFEVIVVENAVRPTLDAWRLRQLGVRHVLEPRRGLDAARNRGAREAAGAVVAYVDDDCELEPGWLTGLRGALVDPEVALVTGRVLPATLALPSQRMFEAWCSWDRGLEQVRHLVGDPLPGFPASAHRLGTGCNMAIRRAVLFEVGGFDEALDMGTLIGGGGDLDVFIRILDAGHGAAYEPTAVVRHRHRETMHDLRWQIWGYGLAQGALLTKGLITRTGVRREIARFGRQRLRHKVRQLLHRGTSALPRRVLAFEVVGILLGPIAYATSMVRLRWQRRRT